MTLLNRKDENDALVALCEWFKSQDIHPDGALQLSLKMVGLEMSARIKDRNKRAEAVKGLSNIILLNSIYFDRSE
jgi:hypothetical protein